MKFKESVFIKQPVDAVFSFATDLNNNCLWQSDVLEAEQTSDGSFGLGATYRCVNTFMGQRLEIGGVVSVYEPEIKCTFKFFDGPITGESSYLFEPLDEGTKFTTVGDLNLNLIRAAKWVAGYFAKQQIKNDLKKLKQVLENGYRHKGDTPSSARLSD